MAPATVDAAAPVETERPPSSRAAANVVASAAAQLTGKVLTLVWTVVAARQLTAEQFGVFNFTLALALIVSALAEWGFDPALVRQASRSPADRNRYYTEAFVWETAAGLLLFGAVLAALLPSRTGAHVGLATVLVFLAVFVDVWNDMARSVGAAAHYQGRTSAALVAQRLVTAAVVLPLLFAGAGIAGLAAGLLVGSAVGWVANLWAMRTFGARMEWGSVRLPSLKEFGRVAAPIGVSSLILVTLARIDTVLIEILKGSEDVAYYAAAYRLFETTLFVMFAVSSATFPMMSAAGDDGPRVREVARSALAATTVLLVPFAAVSFVDAGPVLQLFYAGDYAEQSAGALRWMAVAPLTYSLAYVGGTALIAIGRNRGLMLASATAAGTNVIANLLVIPRFAGTGAAAVTTASYAVEAVVAVLLLRGPIGSLRMASVAPEAWLSGLVMAGVLLALPLPVLVEVPIATLVYVALWMLLVRGRRPEQLQLVASLVPGRGRR